MKSLLLTEYNHLEITDMPLPIAGAGDVLVRVEACGICAGDIKSYVGAESFWGGNGQPKYIKAPMIPGHEFVGHVVELGENVEKQGKFKLGDRVISEQIVPCWECRFCKSGEYWMCEKHDVYGFQNNVNGGFAEYAVCPVVSAFDMPDAIPLPDAAALYFPFHLAWLGLFDRAGLESGESVLIHAAAGGSGSAAVQLAKTTAAAIAIHFFI